MRGLLLVLFTFSTISTGAVLPFGSSFSGPYSKNIHAVVNLIKEICLDEELETAFNETEANGTNGKSDILQLFQKMKKHLQAVKGKNDLRDRIRDLRTDNIISTYEFSQLFSGNRTSGIQNNPKYFELYNNLEKTVIEFLSLDKSEKERRLQLVEEHMTPVGVMLALESLFSDGGLVQTKLKWNKYSDEAFNLIYRLTKNHAILISVATSIKKMMLTPSALDDPEVFQAILSDVTAQYERYLDIIAEANKWREENGFKFDELFTANEIALLEDPTPLPHSTLQNNFILDMETETLLPKYFYFTYKFCNGSHLLASTAEGVGILSGGCRYIVVRSQNRGKELVFYDSQVLASKFRKVVLEKVNDNASLEDILSEFDDSTGLMAVVSSKDLRHEDDLYTVPGAYKLTVHANILTKEYKCSQYYDAGERCLEIVRVVPIKVTGYFLYGNQGSDMVRKV